MVNLHWRTFQDTCLPCKIQYDFVGKLESLDTDVKCLLPRVTNLTYTFPESGVNGPSSAQSRRETTSHSMVTSLIYSNISQEQRMVLLEIYGLDCQMFGYNCEEIEPFL